MTRILLIALAVETFLLWQTTAQRNTLSRDIYFTQTAGHVVCAPEPVIRQLDKPAPWQPIHPTEASH